MQKLFYSLFFILSAMALQAEQIPQELAKKIAQNQLQHIDNASLASAAVSLAHTEKITGNFTRASYKNQSEVHAYYVFNVGNEQGFVLVSADDLLYPVLGYSTKNAFDLDEMPRALVKWLAEYKKQLTYLIEEGSIQSEDLHTAWESHISGNLSSYKRKASVQPLVRTEWNQSPYVNDKCPYDRYELDRAVSGCVATAMAQLMNYWEYPAKGTGYHSYRHPRFGTLSANFGNTTYNWSAMPNSVNSPNDAVATLMYHCGVAVEMNYSVQSSGAYVINADDDYSSENAFEEFFGYDEKLEGVERYDYTNSQWVNLIKAELNADRPVLYAGFGSGGGHAFICDGYDNRDYFHMNWGWGGYYDGYFTLDALNPSGVGTGGGTGGFNSGQQAVIGVEPPQNQGGGSDPTGYDLRLYSSITTFPSTVTFLDGFTVNADIGNFGDKGFSGKWGAAIFDQNDQFVEMIEELDESNFPKNSHYTNGLDFETDGLKAPPGNYKLAILYQPSGGNWTMVADGNYQNYVSLTIQGYDNDIQVYRDIEVDPEEIVQNEPFEIWLDIANTGWRDYTGTISADIHNLDGELIETIDEVEIEDFCDNCHFPDGLTFNSTGVDLEPGTYYLVIWELGDTESDWEIVGSQDKPNPVYVVVREPGLKGDQYESNNSETEAHLFTTTFSNNKASVKTAGANIHEVLDDDYFKVDLPSGYNYSIVARVHDNYEAGDGQEYTNDVLFSYDRGQGFSESFDDVMPASILVANGGEVTFKVSPYFRGDIGSYALELTISRSKISDVSEQPEQILRLYPNPAQNQTVLTGLAGLEWENLQVMGMNGQVVHAAFTRTENGAIVHLQDLAPGVYQLQVTTTEGIMRKKLVVQ